MSLTTDEPTREPSSPEPSRRSRHDRLAHQGAPDAPRPLDPPDLGVRSRRTVRQCRRDRVRDASDRRVERRSRRRRAPALPQRRSLSPNSRSPLQMISASQTGGLDIVNGGNVEHNLAVQGTDLRTAMIPPGGSAHLDLSGLAAGAYTVFCEVAGHQASGMQAMLHLGPAAHGVADGSAAAATAHVRIDDDARADGPGDEGLDRRVPGRDRRARRPGARADGARRRHQAVRPHGRGHRSGRSRRARRSRRGRTTARCPVRRSRSTPATR